ncbi:hypothetical protein E2562_035620 [Oryza meyeriana var. granulata]|uniref:Uncharacterized protein n=1 Tax=Oryza meyeriana var. granulata TaxID=110450 RepID=A0A6G1CAU1_9ORYZ|nr:hypothetical protein E2562_035620 [Oryza meyeriana var. granulata]
MVRLTQERWQPAQELWKGGEQRSKARDPVVLQRWAASFRTDLSHLEEAKHIPDVKGTHFQFLLEAEGKRGEMATMGQI